jgi:nitrate/nitrite transport system permease protein
MKHMDRRGFLQALGGGAPGVGGFLWQEYNSLIYEHIILCIITIGLVGFALDRLMIALERRLRAV